MNMKSLDIDLYRLYRLSIDAWTGQSADMHDSE